MSNNVFVWIEQINGKADSIAWEALGVAHGVADELGGELNAIVLGENVEELARQAIQYGADNAFVANDATLESFRLEPCSRHHPVSSNAGTGCHRNGGQQFWAGVSPVRGSQIGRGPGPRLHRFDR